MKKTAFSLSLLLALTLAGCSSDGVEAKKDNGNDVLFSYVADGKTVNVLANQIYGEMLQTSTGNEKLFNAWLKGVVENVMTSDYESKDDIIKVQVEAEMVEWLQDAKDQASANGVDDDEMIDQLLESEGVDSQDELKAKKLYERRLSELTTQFYKDNRTSYVNDYVENYYPFHVKGVLVKVADGSHTLFNRSITEAEAKKLSLSATQLLNGRSFSGVASDSNLSDHTSTTLDQAGDLGIMDASTSFNNEYKLGVYSYAIYSATGENRANIKAKLGLTDEAETELNEIYKLGIPVIDSSIWEVLENSAEITKDENGNDIVDAEKGDYTSSNLPRNVIFNNYFNAHSISYLGASENTPDDLKTTVVYNATEKEVVLNKKGGTPIIVVTDENGVQFISIEMNPFADKELAKKYYSSKKSEETVNGVTFTPYAALGTGTTSTINDRAGTVDTQVKNYINKGFNSSISANQKFFQYEMFNHYATQQDKVQFTNAATKAEIKEFVNSELAYRATLIENAKLDTWESLLDTLKFQNQVKVGGANGYFDGSDDDAKLVDSWVRPTCLAYQAFGKDAAGKWIVNPCSDDVIEYWSENLVGGSIYDGGNK